MAYEPYRRCSIMHLQPIPDAIQRDRIRVIEGCEEAVDVSANSTEVWAVAVVTVTDEPTQLCGVGRVMIDELYREKVQ